MQVLLFSLVRLGENEMKINDVLKEVKNFFQENINPPLRITSTEKKENGWRVEIEVIEESDYMKRYGKDQLLGVYDVFINNDSEIESFERKSLRPRTATVEEDNQ